MAYNKHSSSKLAVFALLFLCLVQTAFSLKCYNCTTLTDEDCRTNPQQQKFAVDCLPDAYSTMPSMLNFPGYFDKIDKPELEMQCVSVHFAHKGVEVTNRHCLPKQMDCDLIEELIGKQVVLEGCKVCQSDLCNTKLPA